MSSITRRQRICPSISSEAKGAELGLLIEQVMFAGPTGKLRIDQHADQLVV
jgi:hypothetical protein